MSPKDTAHKSEDTFETGLDRLKDIVESLERTDISLDDALNGFEEGIKLSRVLSDKLTQAEARLELLTKNAKGGLETGPLSIEGGSEEDEEEDKEEEDEEDHD